MQFPADLVTFTEEILNMENFVYCVVVGTYFRIKNELV